jgi:hypothetical protein
MSFDELLNDVPYLNSIENIESILKYIPPNIKERSKEEKFKSLVNNLILNLNEGNKIIEYKYKYNWIGCYGTSCLISLDYLMYLNNHYNFFIISNEIINKTMKEVYERFFGLLITYDKKNFSNISLFGNKGNYNYDLNYYNEKKYEMISNNIPYFNYHQHQL